MPGAVDGWSRLLNALRADVDGPGAATVDRGRPQGFGLTERIRADWKSYDGFYVDMLKKDPESRKVFLRNGHVPALYSIFRNPDLARAYSRIAKDGPDGFYRGPIARAIVRRMNAGGADWTMRDLSSFKSEWVNPISTNYKGYQVYEMPPQTQGFATLEMLNIVQQCGSQLGYDLHALGPRSPEFWSILVQAKRLAYTDLLRYDGDPRFVHIPLNRLISKSYAASLCSKISLGHVSPEPAAATKPSVSISRERGDTVYLTTADRWGNMVSFIYSVYDYFGSSVSIPGYGFPMNDRGSFFNLDPSSPDVIAPHKRPFLTIIPAFVMKDGQPLLSFGNMGGDEQAQAQATELVNMIDLGMNVQAAGDAARFHHSQSADQVDLESQLYELVGAQLAGDRLQGRRVPGNDDEFGGYQADAVPAGFGAAAAARVADKGDPPVNGVYRAAPTSARTGRRSAGELSGVAALGTQPSAAACGRSNFVERCAFKEPCAFC